MWVKVLVGYLSAVLLACTTLLACLAMGRCASDGAARVSAMPGCLLGVERANGGCRSHERWVRR